MSKRRTVILCAGYHSHLVTESLRLQGGFEVIGMLDDNRQLHSTVRDGLPILGSLSLLRELKDTGRVDSAALGMGNLSLSDRRIAIYEEARDLGIEMVQVIHPTAFISPTAFCAAGIFAGALAAINAGVKVGENVVIHAGSTIGHDTEIGDHVFISPGVHTGGLVKIKRDVFIGPGVVICSGYVVEEGSVIGAGSVITRDIPGGKLAFGVPARVQKSVEAWQKESPKKR